MKKILSATKKLQFHSRNKNMPGNQLDILLCSSSAVLKGLLSSPFQPEKQGTWGGKLSKIFTGRTPVTNKTAKYTCLQKKTKLKEQNNNGIDFTITFLITNHITHLLHSKHPAQMEAAPHLNPGSYIFGCQLRISAKRSMSI